MPRYYRKLVRDKIPEIIQAAGLSYDTSILDEASYREALLKKLLEEALEVTQADQEEIVEELADLLEVVTAILEAYNIPQADLIAQQTKRHQTRGGFSKKIQLNWTNKPSPSFPHLKPVDTYLKQEVAPLASILDHDWLELQKALLDLGKENLLAVRVPKSLGGLGWDDLSFYHWQMLISSYSGALAFLQTQHQSAASQIALSSNQQLQENYLPYMGNGEILVGVGFSQLRRQGKPDLVAEAVSGGYLISGKVPWITGHQIFSKFIVGASLADCRAIYGLVPFTLIPGHISLHQLDLFAVPSTNTVEAEIKHWFIPEEEIVSIKEPGSLQKADHKNVLQHGYMALGCAKGSLDLLESLALEKSLPSITEARERLLTQWQDLQDSMFSGKQLSYQVGLKYRLQAINLAAKAAQAALIATGGSANIRGNWANRLYKEALLFSLSGQTLDVMQGSLKLLTE